MSKKHRNDFSISLNFSSKGKEEVLEELERESGEDWAQSEDFEKFIFSVSELPSRKFFRRRRSYE